MSCKMITRTTMTADDLHWMWSSVPGHHVQCSAGMMAVLLITLGGRYWLSPPFYRFANGGLVKYHPGPISGEAFVPSGKASPHPWVLETSLLFGAALSPTLFWAKQCCLRTRAIRLKQSNWSLFWIYTGVTRLNWFKKQGGKELLTHIQ